MAEGLLQHGLRARGSQIEVSSAGIGAMDGKPADPTAIKLMQDLGITINSHRSAQFSPAAGIQADLILVMTSEMRESVVNEHPPLQGRVYRLGHWGNFDIADPHMRGEAAFRKALKLIKLGTEEWLQRID